jgi:hypothetical protein
MKDLFKLIIGVLASLFKSRAKLEAEILILRQQINVLRRRMPKRPDLNNTDRLLLVWFYRWFPTVGCTKNLNPQIMVMQPAQNRVTNNVTDSPNGTRYRRILI